MIRTALDSDDPAAIPAGRSHFVFSYSDIVPDLGQLEAKHPGSKVLLIDRGLGDPGRRATLADVENGALTPADLPRWMDEREGVPFLTVYTDRANTAAAIEALKGRPAWHWVATLDGTVFIEGWPPLAGPALVQVADSRRVGLHVDLSLVLNDGWHPAPRVAVSHPVAQDLAELRALDAHLTTTVQRLQTDLQA